MKTNIWLRVLMALTLMVVSSTTGIAIGYSEATHGPCDCYAGVNGVPVVHVGSSWNQCACDRTPTLREQYVAPVPTPSGLGDSLSLPKELGIACLLKGMSVIAPNGKLQTNCPDNANGLDRLYRDGSPGA